MMNNLLKKLGVDETFSKVQKKPKTYNRFINNIVLKPNYNFLADLLMLPTTDKGFKYLLVMMDLATNLFDIEPMKNKDSKTCLEAMKKIFKRKVLKIPYASMRTDNGGEFKNEFDKFLYNNGVLHKYALPYRHTQMAPVENLNGTLGRIFNGYMNKKTIESDKHYNNWTDILDFTRKELNLIRRRDLSKIKQTFFDEDKAGKTTYKINDLVHIKLDHPRDALNNKQNTAQFRKGDIRYSTEAKKIVEIVEMNDAPYYRYIVDGLPNVCYADNQLIPSKKTEETYYIKQIIGKKTEKKEIYYLVWWKNYLKKDATWEPKKQLLEDGFKNQIEEYDKN